MDSHFSSSNAYSTTRTKVFSSNYVLLILWGVALFRMVDMQIIAVLLEPIKAEFSLSDAQLGMLSGFSFALLYSLLGLPVASLADRFNRVTIISVALGFWSLMTILCGHATGFITLFIARMCVGVGESGAYAPSTSLLWDYTKPAFRNRAFSILASAIPVGVFVSFLSGSFLSEAYGWRAVFQFLGIPGLLLSLLLVCTIKDSRQSNFNNKHGLLHKNWFKGLAKLISNKPYRSLLLAACFSTLGATGSGVWMPSFYIRSQGMSLAETGVLMALIYGLGGLLGTYLGGAISDKTSVCGNNQSWVIKLCGYSVTLMLPVAAVLFTTQSFLLLIISHCVFVVLLHINIGPVLATIQCLANDSNRALAQAANVLFSSLIGLGFGSLLIGVFSDALTPFLGSESLGYSMLILVVFAYLLAGKFYFTTAEHLTELKLN